MKILGIDIGGTSTKLGITVEGKVIVQDVIPMIKGQSYEKSIEIIASKTCKLLSEHEGVKSGGIGCAGFIDTKKGIVKYSNNLNWADAEIAEDLKAKTGIEFKIANDAHCAALGEALYGAGKGVDRMVMITIGTGVGGAFIDNSMLCKGGIHNDSAYILGHTTIVSDGKICNCGRRGCLEMYGSATALIKRGEEVLGKKLTAEEIFFLARNKDAKAELLIKEYLNYLSDGFVNIANAFRPKVIVVGGGVSGSCDMILPTINATLKKEVYGYRFAPVKAVKAMLGSQAGIVGAAALNQI